MMTLFKYISDLTSVATSTSSSAASVKTTSSAAFHSRVAFMSVKNIFLTVKMALFLCGEDLTLSVTDAASVTNATSSVQSTSHIPGASFHRPFVTANGVTIVAIGQTVETTAH